MVLKTIRQTNGRKIYQGLLNARYHLCFRKLVRCRLLKAGKIYWESTTTCLPFTVFPWHLLLVTGRDRIGYSSSTVLQELIQRAKRKSSKGPVSMFHSDGITFSWSQSDPTSQIGITYLKTSFGLVSPKKKPVCVLGGHFATHACLQEAGTISGLASEICAWPKPKCSCRYICAQLLEHLPWELDCSPESPTLLNPSDALLNLRCPNGWLWPNWAFLQDWSCSILPATSHST